MGRMKKLTLHDYWSRNRTLHTSFCAKIMTKERFLSILSFLHISNNAEFIPFGAPDHDPVQKVRSFVTDLSETFQALYELEREICVDEAVGSFKGRSRFKVYIKDKPTKWGFKCYEPSESSSAYVHNFELFCGDKRLSNKPVDVVLRLMEPLKDKGYYLYLDNYYCCVELWDKLRGGQTMM